MSELENKIELLINDESMRKSISNNAFELLMNSHTWEMNAKEIIKTSGII